MRATIYVIFALLGLSICNSPSAQTKPVDKYQRYLPDRSREDTSERLRRVSEFASVKVVNYRSDGNSVDLFIEVVGATSESKVVVFAADGYTNKFRPARGLNGDIAFASTNDQLRSLRMIDTHDPKALEEISISKSKWISRIRYPSSSSNSFDVVVALYRVVDQANWSEGRLVDGFKYLPFEDGKPILEIFTMTERLGWNLEKYTSLQGK